MQAYVDFHWIMNIMKLINMKLLYYTTVHHIWRENVTAHFNMVFWIKNILILVAKVLFLLDIQFTGWKSDIADKSVTKSQSFT